MGSRLGYHEKVERGKVRAWEVRQRTVGGKCGDSRGRGEWKYRRKGECGRTEEFGLRKARGARLGGDGREVREGSSEGEERGKIWEGEGGKETTECTSMMERGRREWENEMWGAIAGKREGRNVVKN